MHLKCVREEEFALLSCSSTRCSLFLLPFFRCVSPSPSLFLSPSLSALLCALFILALHTKFMGFIMWFMQCALSATGHATQRDDATQRSAGNVPIDCVLSLTHTHKYIYTYVCVHDRSEGEECSLFFITPSVFMASTRATLPWISLPLPAPLTHSSRFTYLISQLALASVVFVIDSTECTWDTLI